MPKARRSFHDYYWGCGSRGAPCFREDINRVVPDRSKRRHADDCREVMLLYPDLEERASSCLEGRHRDQFLIALFFTVLIDQGIHYYYRQFHSKFDRLTAPPKISLTGGNLPPEWVFSTNAGWRGWTKENAKIFYEAEAVFKDALREFLSKHIPDVDADEAWAKFSRHYPSNLLNSRRRR